MSSVDGSAVGKSANGRGAGDVRSAGVTTPGSRRINGWNRPDRADTVSARKARHTAKQRAWRIGTVVVFLLAGVLMGTARSYSHGEDIRNRSVDLSGLVHGAASRVATAESKAAVVQSQIDDLAGSEVSPQVTKALAAGDALQAPAGLTAVAGPALRVSLSDAQRDSDGNYPADVDPDDLVVHQQDVQSVVNALWAGGAEAMTIMDQRVVTTSAVRCIGNTLLLQGRAVLAAVRDHRHRRLVEDGGGAGPEPGVALFQTYVQQYQLGFEIDPVANVTLPAYAGLVRMTAAHQETK